ncbi:MAG: ribonuclease P protein component [Candidatus Magasanikbacteria bacterium CG10_big_fil_rev_8_21_14_0_10_43_6]|uniref:Ribonuclease P protein component n=1 Tax=Candidatus Magasanikbacteria bacterium CG10_big_fil_rev_8_21_14_0_10_43_6 TaxID=1974650 RepID=A0A2M6W1X0_9BACT|nr:MAG: ribonuclease P protein component [Candidatus Magasanikbacteria bacterium CG10_big_fil_rev_8_21_14_0_10_43_6]
MLPKEYRLKKKRDFEIAFENGRFVGGALTTMKVWQINPQKYPKRGYAVDMLKIGFVVGKKVSKSAVKRNRVKRQMREVVRLLQKGGRLRQGYLLIVMAKPGILDVSYPEIEKDLTAVLARARVLL